MKSLIVALILFLAALTANAATITITGPTDQTTYSAPIGQATVTLQGTAVPSVGVTGIFVASNGSAGGDGSNANPYPFSYLMNTTASALPRPRPIAGQNIWIIKDHQNQATGGTYPPLVFNCNAGQENGTSAIPITIRNQNERVAHIRMDGSRNSALEIQNCGYWRFQGLHLSRSDNEQGALKIWFNNNLEFKQILVSGTGPTGIGRPATSGFKDEGVHMYQNTNLLMEEIEVYHFGNHCYKETNELPSGALSRSTKIYCNSRTSEGYLPVSAYPSRRSTFENIIAENLKGGGNLNGGGVGASFNRWYNFIGLYYGGDGFSTSAEAGSVAGGYGQDSVFENIMLKNPSGGSFGGSAAINDQVKNITIWGPIARNGYGVSIGTAPVNVGTTGGQFTCINCFVMTANNGFLITPNTSVTGLSTWQLLNPATVNTVTPFSPTIGGSGGKIIGAVNGTGIVDTTTRTLMEQCPIQVGGTGNQLKGAGSASGASTDIGANILYLYENGKQDTTKKLWNTVTGELNTAVWGGARITGINDVGTPNSLANVGQRLGNKNCSWPSGY